MSVDQAAGIVADFGDVFVDSAIPALAPLMSNQGLLDRWRAIPAHLSPPDIGKLRDLERAMGLEPIPIPPRDRPDPTEGLAATVLALAGLATADKRSRGDNGDIRVSVSDPNAGLRRALDSGDMDALRHVLTSKPWSLDNDELMIALEGLPTDASWPGREPITPEEILSRLISIRTRRIANDKNHRAADQPPRAG